MPTSKPLHVHVVPAAPGFRVVYEGDEDDPLFLGEEVIAWRIETMEDKAGGTNSQAVPITCEGDADAIWGILEPSGQVVRPHHYTVDSLDKAKATARAELAKKG